jgi:hypothetical protein
MTTDVDNKANKPDEKPAEKPLEAQFSTLVLSIGSSAMMALGLAPHPSSEKVEKNLAMAQFHIDLLLILKDKTKNNLNGEESQFLDFLIHDLQLKYVQAK